MQRNQNRRLRAAYMFACVVMDRLVVRIIVCVNKVRFLFRIELKKYHAKLVEAVSDEVMHLLIVFEIYKLISLERWKHF